MDCGVLSFVLLPIKTGSQRRKEQQLVECHSVAKYFPAGVSMETYIFQLEDTSLDVGDIQAYKVRHDGDGDTGF